MLRLTEWLLLLGVLFLDLAAIFCLIVLPKSIDDLFLVIFYCDVLFFLADELYELFAIDNYDLIPSLNSSKFTFASPSKSNLLIIATNSD